MEEKNSQKSTIDAETLNNFNSSFNSFNTAVDINNLSSEMKSDIFSRTKQHRENIDKIIVPQYIDDQYVKDNNYVFTYDNKEYDNSLLGWKINVEKNGQQQPDTYFNLNQKYDISSFVLYKKYSVIRLKINKVFILTKNMFKY